MKFETVLLENSDIQLIDGDRGKNYPKQADFSEDGFCLFLSAKNVTSSGFEFSERSYISSEKDELLRAGKLQRGDIVVTTRGTIGNVAYYGDDVPFDHIRINSGMMIFRADESRWNKRFLYFLLTSSFIRQQIDSLTSGSAVPQLPARDLKKFSLPNIPKFIQDRIERIVGDLTDKIKFNRQTNQTLEQIAQALFKSWFVDFDPVKTKIKTLASGGSADDAELAAMGVISAKTLDELNSLKDSNSEAFNKIAQTAALFPAAMQDSELGEIPEGWRIKSIYDICNVIYGAPFKSKLFNTDKKGLPLVRIRDLKNESPGVFTEEVHSKGYLIQNGDIVVGMDGEFRPYIWGGNEAWMNQRVCCFKPTNDNHTYLVRNFIDSQLSHFEKTATATTVIHLGKGDIDTFSYIDAGEKIFNLYSEKTARLCEYFVRNKIESLTLSQLRDSLLPKLLSGEIDFTSEVVA